MQLWALLGRQVELYTLGESTSLPEHDARQLMTSVCFVLGIDTRALDVEHVRELLKEGVEQAYKRRLMSIELAVTQTSTLWKEVCLTMPLLESVALRDTLSSLRQFSARYNPRFFAHEIPADIDYPLSCPVSEAVQGVEYVMAYLERLLAECQFLRALDCKRCDQVLRLVHPEYGVLLINLFEQVATNAVGCVLAGVPARLLLIDEAAREHIADAFSGCTKKQMSVRLEEAADSACEDVGIASNTNVREAVRFVACGLVPRLQVALEHGTLTGVFLGPA